MTRHELPQTLDECFIHHREIVRHVQTNDALAEASISEFRFQSLQMALFHHENDVGPPQMPARNPNPGARLSPGRTGLMALETIKHALGRQASLLVLAADKQNFQESCYKKGGT